jgi:hypothetical protein
MEIKKLVYKDGWKEEMTIYSEYMRYISEKEQAKKLNKERYNTFLVFHSGRTILSSMNAKYARDSYYYFLKIIRTCHKEIEEKLKIGAPRLVKHCRPTEAIEAFYRHEQKCEKAYCKMKHKFLPSANQCDTNLKVHSNKKLDLDALNFRTNRYSPFGHTISQIPVTFSWEGITFGEIRDLNRHRTGSKYCSLVPIGFYGATDEVPIERTNESSKIIELYTDFEQSTLKSRELMKEYSEYIYFTNLGHKYYFEHTTTADKFLYEMELRTGVGAHYKYAEHCHKMLELWFQKYPQSKGLIFEGSAEPE